MPDQRRPKIRSSTLQPRRKHLPSELLYGLRAPRKPRKDRAACHSAPRQTLATPLLPCREGLQGGYSPLDYRRAPLSIPLKRPQKKLALHSQKCRAKTKYFSGRSAPPFWVKNGEKSADFQEKTRQGNSSLSLPSGSGPIVTDDSYILYPPYRRALTAGL